MSGQQSVVIEWGNALTRADNPGAGITYTFDTAAELCAFLQGVEAADGWMEHTIIELNGEKQE